jgi:hypothetical protein
MGRLHEYEQELVEIINNSQDELEKDHEVFEKYAPMIRKMSERAYQLFEGGYQDSLNWGNHSISMANDGLSDLHRSMVNRAEGARKAAATRKANKAKATS